MNDRISPITAGSIAVVTGAAGGIGSGIARDCAARGMRVVIVDINGDAAEATAQALRDSGGEASAFACDISDNAAIEALAEAVFGRHGSVGLLVNNAAIQTVGLAWELTAERWRKMIDVNVLGAVNMTRAFVPRMAATGRPGHIANVCSLGSLVRIPVETAYITTKHALLAFSECLALDLQTAGYDITVSAVLPGTIATGFFRDDAGQGASGVEHMREMQESLHQGMPTDEAGAVIVRGIAAGDFWVTTHPEMLQWLSRMRAEQIGALKTPLLGEMGS